jgi:general secretion pathway protein G
LPTTLIMVKGNTQSFHHELELYMSSADIKLINYQKGFTLIELLVVISIIGLLSGLILVSTQGTRAQARDSRRLSDMNQIIKGITLYYDKYGAFPPITADDCQADWDVGPCAANPSNLFIGALQTSKIIGSVPFDPAGFPNGATADDYNYGYSYYVFPAGSEGCEANRGNFFVLGIRDMETGGNPNSKSPGFKCANRDWQDEFEWVTGAFENDF